MTDTRGDLVQKYTYTIFDAHPGSSGDCAWPSHEQVEVYADDADVVLAQALDEARAEGAACGAYPPGYRLYATVWDDESGLSVAEGSVTLPTDDDD